MSCKYCEEKKRNIKSNIISSIEDFKYKNSMYSLQKCKEFIRNIAENINYSDDEGILTSTFHYLEEYENELKSKEIMKLTMLFWTEYIGEDDFYNSVNNGGIYPVIEELEDKYVIKNNINSLSVLEKSKFKTT